jgi:PadR family transcriptional regulator AphA
MSLKHAILVLLESERSSGYDIVKSFNRAMGYFWNASHQQVYQELKKMTDEGWVTFDVEAQTGNRPDKKRYASTKQGKQELQSWLNKTAKHPKINDALLIKIYAGELNDMDALKQEIDDQYAHYSEMLNSFLSIEQVYMANDDEGKAKWKMPYLTLKRGIYGLEAWIKWADEVKKELP